MLTSVSPSSFKSAHGTPSTDVAKLWDRVISLFFVLCLILFSRALFFTTSGDPLLGSPFPSTAQPTLYSRSFGKPLPVGSTPKDLFRHEPLPKWDPAMAANLTTGTGIGIPLEQQAQGVADGHALNATQVTALSFVTSTTNNLANRERARFFLPADSSTEKARRQTSASESSVESEGGVDGAVYKIPSLRIATSAAGYDPLEQDPFFATEEFDDMGQTFALKIWLDGSDRSKTGRLEFCQASSGVRCLQAENQYLV